MADLLTVAVLSYNRGPWLQHCLDSLADCLPSAPVLLVDDNSDDPATCALLQSLPGKVRLIQPEPGAKGLHGGLYANMQRALDACQTPLILFLQDDTQLVRPIPDAEVLEWRQHMETAPKAFVGPLFVQGRQAHGLDRRISPYSGLAAYTQNNSSVKNPKPLAYRDVVLAHVELLRAAGWRFSGSEKDNAQTARQIWGAMPILLAPFVAFSPEVPTFRSKGKTLAARWAEARLGRDPKPFAPMTAQDIERLHEAPFGPRLADDYLKPRLKPARKGQEPNAVDVFPWLRHLDRLETRFRRLIRRR